MVTMLKCDLISVLTIWMVCKYVGSTAIHYGVGSSTKMVEMQTTAPGVREVKATS